jgi:hypothetical protein
VPLDLACDCNNNAHVSIAELVRSVSVALGMQSIAICPLADVNADGTVMVEEIVNGVSAAMLP